MFSDKGRKACHFSNRQIWQYVYTSMAKETEDGTTQGNYLSTHLICLFLSCIFQKYKGCCIVYYSQH